MAELESVLFTDELEISGDKNKNASNRTRKMAINGDDEMLALLKKRAIS
jgi:mediator of RNA polymerase II transcription subunit 10